MKNNTRPFEWIKVKTYPAVIDGKLALETLYRKIWPNMQMGG